MPHRIIIAALWRYNSHTKSVATFSLPSRHIAGWSGHPSIQLDLVSARLPRQAMNEATSSRRGLGAQQ